MFKNSIIKKVIALFLLVITSLQSCAVYQKTPVSLEDAVDQGKVKIERTRGRPALYYKSIFLENDSYYVSYEDSKIELDTSNILFIYLKDQQKSKIATIGGVGILLSITTGLILVIGFYTKY